METKYLWKGAVGAQIRRKINGTTHEHFYTVRPVRCYKSRDSEQWKYAYDFTPEQLETLVDEVIPEAKAFVESATIRAESGIDSVIAFAEPDGFATGPTPEGKSTTGDS